MPEAVIASSTSAVAVPVTLGGVAVPVAVTVTPSRADADPVTTSGSGAAKSCGPLRRGMRRTLGGRTGRMMPRALRPAAAALVALAVTVRPSSAVPVPVIGGGTTSPDAATVRPNGASAVPSMAGGAAVPVAVTVTPTSAVAAPVIGGGVCVPLPVSVTPTRAVASPVIAGGATVPLAVIVSSSVAVPVPLMGGTLDRVRSSCGTTRRLARGSRGPRRGRMAPRATGARWSIIVPDAATVIPTDAVAVPVMGGATAVPVPLTVRPNALVPDPVTGAGRLPPNSSSSDMP